MSIIVAVLTVIFISGSGEVELLPYKTYDNTGHCMRDLIELRQKHPLVYADCTLLRSGEMIKKATQ